MFKYWLSGLTTASQLGGQVFRSLKDLVTDMKSFGLFMEPVDPISDGACLIM